MPALLLLSVAKTLLVTRFEHASVGACVGARGELGFRHQLARFVHFARYNFADLARLLGERFLSVLNGSYAAFVSGRLRICQLHVQLAHRSGIGIAVDVCRSDIGKELLAGVECLRLPVVVRVDVVEVQAADSVCAYGSVACNEDRQAPW